MSRTIRLHIAFDGTAYHGWQRQRKDVTVQGMIEKKLNLLCKQEITLHGAGRTDAGVHAEEMVAHFHLEQPIPLTAFCHGLNSMLPGDIRILEAMEEGRHFHSRFSALGKTYRYDFFTGAIQHPASRLYCAHFPGPFDHHLIEEPLAALEGTHDFSSFERVGSRDKTNTEGRGAVRTIHKAACIRRSCQPHHWSISITGDGFLRQMVRILAGTLIEIGQGKRSPSTMTMIIDARDRKAAGLTAPAHGLFLEKIYYDRLFVV